MQEMDLNGMDSTVVIVNSLTINSLAPGSNKLCQIHDEEWYFGGRTSV